MQRGGVFLQSDGALAVGEETSSSRLARAAIGMGKDRLFLSPPLSRTERWERVG